VYFYVRAREDRGNVLAAVDDVRDQSRRFRRSGGRSR
jgi:hypothetical protein